MIPLSDEPRARRVPFITILLILVNVAVFIYELGLSPRRLDTFVSAFGTVPVEILTGRDLPPASPDPIYLTLITAMFIHGGFLHIGSNMLYLWVFGDNIEDAFGHTTYLLFYFASGILAGLAHVFVNTGSDIPSVGASGAIAGVLGAYLLMFPGAQVRTLLFLGPILLFPRISAFILIGFWFVSQFLSGVLSLEMRSEQTSGVAVWAHIGGFVAGFLLALVLRPRDRARPTAPW